MMRDRVVLIGAVGMSPAVLTETVWALAQEDPPLIPDEVVAITTSSGRERIQKELLDSGTWSELQQVLKAPQKLKFGASASIQVIGNGQRDFADIVTPEENEQAADFLMQQLRRYSEDANTRIIASIAGGRKTMSALMLACMSLLGREQDRVCHVLANDDYLVAHKGFCFPRSAAEADAAQIRLSDIPFIRVRGWYRQESGKAPASYSHMVSLFRDASPEAVVLPEIVLEAAPRKITVGESEYLLDEAEFMAAWTFWKNRRAGKFADGADLAEAVQKFGIRSLAGSEDFSKRLNAVKTKIKKDHPSVVEYLFPGIRARAFQYPSIRFLGHPQTSKK